MALSLASEPFMALSLALGFMALSLFGPFMALSLAWGPFMALSLASETLYGFDH